MALVATCSVVALAGGGVVTTATAQDAEQAERRVEVVIQGITFRIPRDYVTVAFWGGAGAVDLRVLAANFKPYTPATAPDFPRDSLLVSVRIWIEGSDDPRPAAERIRILDDIWEGLVTRPAETLGPAEAVAAGLPVDLPVLSALPGPDLREDRFVVPAVGTGADRPEPRESIFCTSPHHALARANPVRPPLLQCSYRFAYRGILVRLGFERHLLARWRELRANTVTLLDGFVQHGR